MPTEKTTSKEDIYVHTFNALRALNVIRSLVAFCLLSVVLLNYSGVHWFDILSNQTFLLITLVYLLLVLCIAFSIQDRWFKPHIIVFIGVGGDLILLTTTMLFGYGLESGIGTLIFLMIFGSSLLVHLRTALFFVALACFALFLEETLLNILKIDSANYTHAALLGMALFMTTVVGQKLAKRADKQQALARERAEDVAYVSMLNRFVMEQLPAGMLVVDKQHNIRMCNRAAYNMLSIQSLPSKTHLSTISLALHRSLLTWLQSEDLVYSTFLDQKDHGQIRALFLKLDSAHSPEQESVVIIFERMERVKQQAQQLKMRSLGILAAGIAHEIRNPLGAMTHAVQLLSEMGTRSRSEDDLIQLVLQNSKRINRMIENVQSLSRNQPFVPREIVLEQWVEAFVQEFRTAYQLDDTHIVFEPAASHQTKIYVDPLQLHQVVWNIADNATRHGGTPLVIRFAIGKTSKAGLDLTESYLEITDNGKGMDVATADKMFQPFFSNQPQGSGLGLYLAHELCQANGAELLLVDNSANGCAFRIVFRPFFITLS